MNIRSIRKELGLSQLEFARLLNVHQTAVSQWETGRTCPETEMIYRMARILGRSAGEIMDEDFQKKREAVFETVMPDNGMLEARIRKDDTVYYRSTETVENGAIVAAETDQGVTVRYYYEKNGQRFLVSASGGYEPVVLGEGDRILGRVYAFKSIL